MLFTTLFSLLVLVEATQPLNIPTLKAPDNTMVGKPPNSVEHVWEREHSVDLVHQLKNMQFGGENAEDAGIDTDQQQQYVAELSALGAEIKQESEEVAAVKKKERETEAQIKAEAEQLRQVKAQQNTMVSLTNAAGSVANKILLSDYEWDAASGQAAKSETFLDGQESNIVSVLAQGANLLEEAKAQIAELDGNGKRQVNALKDECVDPLYDWNFNATKDLNQQVVGLADVLARVEELTKNFDLAHSKTMDMIQILAKKEKDEVSLIETHATAKAMLAQPIMPLNPMKGVGLDEVGFWPKLKVLKTMFEHSTGEVLGPFEAFEKKLHDA